MRFVKYLFIIIVLITLAMAGGWYYTINKITSEINNYAGKEIKIGKDNTIYFDEAVPAGFPYKISWKLMGLKESTGIVQNGNASEVTYQSPLQLGYNLLTQKVFASYDGKIKSMHKPVNRNQGVMIDANNISVTASLPLTMSLFNTVKNMKDPVEIFNHVGGINISSGAVKIFDLANNKKYYDKVSESIYLTFVHKKRYMSVEDILNNIPQNYTVSYRAKTNETAATLSKLPNSLIYNFALLPSGAKISLDAKIKTAANKHTELKKGLNVDADVTLNSKYIDITNLDLVYHSKDALGKNYDINNSTKIRLKQGAFDALFARYPQARKKIIAKSSGKIFDREMQYIIENKKLFKFHELENSNYYLKLDMNAYASSGGQHFKVKNMSLKSDTSGISLIKDMNISKSGRTKSNGDLIVHNYPRFVDFSSAYIYRFGEFKFLKDKARKIYVSTTKSFLKDISDNPKSSSDDLSFNFIIDSARPTDAKFGNSKISALKERFMENLYKKLLNNVGVDGDVLKKLQGFIPGVNADDKLLQKLIPGLGGAFSDKTGEKDSSNEGTSEVRKQIEEVIPKDAKKVIDKIIPGGKKIDKKLLKNLF